MSGIQPVAVYAMQIPPGDILVPAVPDFAAMFRVSMAAIDPSAEPEYEDVDGKKTPRATLKIVRVPGDMFDDEDSEDEEDEEEALLNGINGGDSEDDDDDYEEEEENGGPSDPAKAKAKKSKLDLVKAIAEADAGEEDDEAMSEDDAKAAAALSKIMKGKGKASEEDDEHDDLDDFDDESLEMDETVVCTLDPETHYQQPLDIVVGEDEKIFFKVSGNFTIHLTGNYVIPMDDGQAQLYDEDEEDEDYDLSPDEGELEMLEEGESESDELDDLEDPRVMEVDTDEDQPEMPKLVKNAAGKGKNKRPAPPSDDEEEPNLDDLMEKSLKAPESALTHKEEPPKKLTKSEKKRLKKMKMLDGEAITTSTAGTTPVATASKPAEPLKKENSVNGEKKVQFAKNLEQGPTPSATSPPATKSDNKKPDAKDSKATLGVKKVDGVTVDDRKLGTGPAAKKGNKVGMRFIGKLEDGKVFDANKKGKPFAFKLGSGEVIKGWDIGVVGMSVGGERRITVPAHLGYGSKGAPPDIPPNSTLIFDLKVLTIT